MIVALLASIIAPEYRYGSLLSPVIFDETAPAGPFAAEVEESFTRFELLGLRPIALIHSRRGECDLRD